MAYYKGVNEVYLMKILLWGCGQIKRNQQTMVKDLVCTTQREAISTCGLQIQEKVVAVEEGCLIRGYDLKERNSASNRCNPARRDPQNRAAFFCYSSICSQGLAVAKSNKKPDGKGAQVRQCVEVSLWGWGGWRKAERESGRTEYMATCSTDRRQN